MFFFQQKTAYEMRMRDWSSDVCSSDLVIVEICPVRHKQAPDLVAVPAADALAPNAIGASRNGKAVYVGVPALQNEVIELEIRGVDRTVHPVAHERSEEHTSELQSLMRI